MSAQRRPRRLAATAGRGAARLSYFGRQRGSTLYSWMADTYTVFAHKLIPGTQRDSLHVLDGLLANQTGSPGSPHFGTPPSTSTVATAPPTAHPPPDSGRYASTDSGG